MINQKKNCKKQNLKNLKKFWKFNEKWLFLVDTFIKNLKLPVS